MTDQTESVQLPAEFRSSNSVPVERATITRERMAEILLEAAQTGRDAGLEAAREIYAALQVLLPIVEEYRNSGEYSGSEAAKDWPEIDLAKAALARAAGE